MGNCGFHLAVNPFYQTYGRYAFTEAADDQLRPLRDPLSAKDDD
jgi:hypothetical protein